MSACQRNGWHIGSKVENRYPDWIPMTMKVMLTHSLVVRSWDDPFHHEIKGAGLEPVTSHFKSYEWLADRYFTSWSNLIVNGRTNFLQERREEKLEMKQTRKLEKISSILLFSRRIQRKVLMENNYGDIFLFYLLSTTVWNTYSSSLMLLNSWWVVTRRCWMIGTRSYYANPSALIYLIARHFSLFCLWFELTCCSGERYHATM